MCEPKWVRDLEEERDLLLEKVESLQNESQRLRAGLEVLACYGNYDVGDAFVGPDGKYKEGAWGFAYFLLKGESTQK